MRVRLAFAVMLAAIGLSGTASAQTAVDGRLDRLEAEMRAVQRKVFPGGAGAQSVEPQYTAPQGSAQQPGTPSSSPISDINARLGALESSLATLTGQVEQLQYHQKQIEESLGATRRMLESRIKVLEDASTSIGAQGNAQGNGPVPAGSAAAAPRPVMPRPDSTRTDLLKPEPAKPVVKPAPPKPVATPPAGGKDDPERAAKVAAIAKGNSGDPAEDGYLYGYHLWAAKFYPEAIVALKEVTVKYPDHRRWSYAQNLLGRSYLDSGAPSVAAKIFYDNYRTKPEGERAPESLYYLAQALMLRKAAPADVCRVYTELSEVYGAKLSDAMKAGMATGRATEKCP